MTEPEFQSRGRDSFGFDLEAGTDVHCGLLTVLLNPTGENRLGLTHACRRYGNF